MTRWLHLCRPEMQEKLGKLGLLLQFPKCRADSGERVAEGVELEYHSDIPLDIYKVKQAQNWRSRIT